MTSKQIFNKVTEITGYGKVILKSTSRSKSFVRARAFFSIICRAYGMSYPEIGALLDRTHDTIINQIKSFQHDQVIGEWILKLDNQMVDQYFKDLK